jgi:hypothetical protein
LSEERIHPEKPTRFSSKRQAIENPCKNKPRAQNRDPEHFTPLERKVRETRMFLKQFGCLNRTKKVKACGAISALPRLALGKVIQNHEKQVDKI